MHKHKHTHITHLYSTIFVYLNTHTHTHTYTHTHMEFLHHIYVSRDNVAVTVIAPGTIFTDITAPFWTTDESTLPRSMAQDPETFAAHAYKDILHGNGYISYPAPQFYQSYLGGTLPPSVRATVSKYYGKTGMAGKRVT